MQISRRFFLTLIWILGVSSVPAQTSPRLISAETAYSDPVDGLKISSEGASRWNEPGTTLTWYGQVRKPGSFDASVILKMENGAVPDLQLDVNGKTLRGQQVAGGDGDQIEVRFGKLDLQQTGYTSFTLSRADNDTTRTDRNFTVASLKLVGETTSDIHFNTKPRRNAASVHLAYPVNENLDVSAFYCEMTALEDPIWSYYMACGWHRGYFGMQVNSPTERRIIFSVWDSGGEAVDRKKVEDENRVSLIDKGEDVFTGDFGNEGTGGHSHLKFDWKTGQKQRFLVTAQPTDSTHTIFAGYYFRPDTDQWMLISSWKAPKEGSFLRGIYSFSENFVGDNGHLMRKAHYGNQWIRTDDGRWIELTRATFSHDPTGEEDRLDRSMGIESGQFFLLHGGFTNDSTPYGQPFDRPATEQSPEKMSLPALPPVVSR